MPFVSSINGVLIFYFICFEIKADHVNKLSLIEIKCHERYCLVFSFCNKQKSGTHTTV